MLQVLASPSLTVALLLFFAGYLFCGKIGWIPLDPRILAGTAVALAIQSLLAASRKLWILLCRDPGESRRRGVPLSMPPFAIRTRLLEAGLEEASSAAGTLFGRRLKVSIYVEAGLLALIFLTFLSGFMHYGLGVSGTLRLAPGSEWVNLATIPVQRGFLVSREEPALQVRARDLAADLFLPEITLDIRHDEQEKSLTLRPGESWASGSYRLSYSGDSYLVFLSLMQNRHDFMPAPVRLVRDEEGIYRGPILVSDVRHKGEAVLSRDGRSVQISIWQDGQTLLQRTVELGSRSDDGVFIIGAPAHSHEGTILLHRFGFKTFTLAGFIAIGFLALLRLVLRPQAVLLDEGNGTLHFLAGRRRMIRLLKACPVTLRERGVR